MTDAARTIPFSRAGCRASAGCALTNLPTHGASIAYSLRSVQAGDRPRIDTR